ncbi:MAG: immunoglobulin domain-containing protein [Bacteroidota bacterium]
MNLIFKIVVTLLLLIVINATLYGQCFNGRISGFPKTEYCQTESTSINLIGETEFFGDIEAPISPVFTISPSVGSGFTDNGNGTAVFNPSQVGFGTYTITLDFDSGLDCKELGIVTFTVFEVEVVAIEIEDLACEGAALNLATSETFENIEGHRWTGPNNFTSSLTFPTIDNASSLNSGIYAVTVTYETGCTATASRNITINPAPAFTLNSNDPSCVGENLTIQVVGEPLGGTYNWTGPNNFTSNTETVTINDLTTANAGTYTLAYTTNNNCEATRSVEVDLSTLPEPILTTSGDFCGGDATLVLQDNSIITYEYNWRNQVSGTTYNGKVVSINNPLATDAGVYRISVTNSAGCEVIENLAVAYKGDTPQLKITGDNTVCAGGSIQLRETGDGGQNHVWTGPNNLEQTGINLTINDISNQNAGIYEVTANDGNGCTASANITVSISPSPELTLVANEVNPCEGSTLELSEMSGDLVNWFWTGPNNFRSNQPNPTISNIGLTASGTYTLRGRNIEGCETESTIDIEVSTSFNAGTGRNRTLCGGPVVNLIDLLTGADTGGVFLDDNNTNALNGNQLNTANLPAGLYFFTYTSAENSPCATTTRVAISINTSPVITVSTSTTEACTGANIQLRETGGEAVSWSWRGPNNFVSNEQNPLINDISLAANGNYELTVTNEVGCSATSSVDVVVQRTFNAGISRDLQVCSGAQVDLTNLIDNADPGGIFFDESGTERLTGAILETEGLASGDYNFSYSLAETSACISRTSFIVRVQDQLNAGADINLNICQDEILDLTTVLSNGSTIGGEFVDIGESGALTGNQFDGSMLNPATYQIIYRVGDRSICPVDEATIAIGLNPIPNAPNLNDATICEGETISLSATDGISYDWTNGASTSTITVKPTTTTTYGVTLTNDFNCTNSGAATITVNSLPSLAVSPNSSICEGENLQLSASGAITYSWSPSIGLNNVNSSNPIANPITTTSYEVIGTNEEGCSTQATVNVQVNDNPTITTSEDISFCLGTGTTLFATGQGTIRWTPVIGLDNPNSSTPLANPNTSTDYQAILTDTNGCVDTGKVRVVVEDLPNIDLGPDQTICRGEVLELVASGGETYLWEAPDALNNPTAAIQKVSPQLATTYQVIVIGDNNCEATDEITILVNETPTANAGEDQLTCTGVAAILVGSGGDTYEWSNGASDAVITVSPKETTTYTLIVANEFGCTDTDEVLVDLVPEFAVQVSSDTFFCLGESTQLNAVGGSSYTWSPAIGLDDVNVANPTASPTTTTTYAVEIKDEMGCIVNRAISIEVKQVENFTLTPNQDVCEGNSIRLEASGGQTYNWFPNNAFANPNVAIQEVSPSNDAIYRVEVMDEFGCKTSDSVQVTVRPIPTVTLEAVSEICEGENLSLLGGSIDVVEWDWIGVDFSSNEQNAQVINILPNQSGQFKLIGRTEFGCENADSLMVVVNASPAGEIVVAEKLCENTELVLRSSNSNTNVVQTWTGVDGATFEGSTWELGPAQISFSGIYQLAIIDENGCQNQREQAIEVITMPKAGEDTTFASCQGEFINLRDLLSGADASGTFELGAGLPTLDNTTLNTAMVNAGTYLINYSVEQETCPTAVATLTLEIDTPKAAGLDNSTTVCQGTSVALNDLLQAADVGGSYQATTNPNALIGDTWQTEALLPNTYLLNYVQTNACGTDEAQLSIEVLEQVKAGPAISTDLCKGIPFDLSELLTDATEGGVFQDLTGTNALIGSQLTTTDLPLGDYVFAYEIASINECPSDTAQITITLKDLLTAGLDNEEAFCTGPTIDLKDLLVGADNGGSFTPISIAPPTLTEDIIATATLASDTYTFAYKVGGTAGCPEDVATISVVINQSPNLQWSVPNDFVCLGDTILIEASASSGTGALTLEWQTPNGLFTGNQVSATQTGTYQINVTDEAACSTQLDTVINSNTAIDVAIEGRTAICQNEDLTLQPSTTEEVLNYKWLLPNGAEVEEATLIIEADQIVSGNYRLQYTDQFNCQQATDTMITISPGTYFRSNFLTANMACMGDSLQLIEISDIQLSPTATYEWDFGDGQISRERDPTHVFQRVGLFPVSVKINDQDCGSESMVKEVNILACRKLSGEGLPFKQLNLYPNPTQATTNLVIELEKVNEVLLRITDIYGRVVQETTLNTGSLINEQLQFAESGIYFIRLKTLGEQQVLKLVVE